MIDMLSCERCGLSKKRRNVVQGRGEVPADILFIGEAPGRSEDLLGRAFVGPSGKLLDKMLEDARALTSLGSVPSYYISNTVLCRPSDHEGENRAPKLSEVLSCRKNISAIISEVDPDAVIFIGQVAERYYKRYVSVPAIRIIHPAALLRRGGKKCPQYRDSVRRLADIFNHINGR